MNPKVSRIAQDLLMAVAVNCNTQTPSDMEVLIAFSKLRFKNKPNINLYLQCARELVMGHPDNLPHLLKHVIYNELSNARNMNNMSILSSIFNCDPERGASSLATVFCELLLQKECYWRALRYVRERI